MHAVTHTHHLWTAALARVRHPRQNARPSHKTGKLAHSVAEQDVARLAHHYARPRILVSALCGPGLHCPKDETSTPFPAAPLLRPLLPPITPPPSWITIQGPCQAGADHHSGHTPPCSDDPRAIRHLGNHGNTLHARAQTMAAHGLPRGGEGILGLFRQSLLAISGGTMTAPCTTGATRATRRQEMRSSPSSPAQLR